LKIKTQRISIHLTITNTIERSSGLTALKKLSKNCLTIKISSSILAFERFNKRFAVERFKTWPGFQKWVYVAGRTEINSRKKAVGGWHGHSRFNRQAGETLPI